MQMDPQIKLLAAMKREITKIVGKAKTHGDKKMLIDFGERILDEISDNIEGEMIEMMSKDSQFFTLDEAEEAKKTAEASFVGL